MKKIFNYIGIVALIVGFYSCDNLFSPMDENLVSEDYATTDPASAEGILANAYTGVISQYTFTCTATDDAVSNQLSNGYRRMATGELTSIYNPLSRWGQYTNVFYVNKFLSIMDKVTWMKDTTLNVLFARRMHGEALALRALHHAYVLENFAGKDNSGKLLGIPYFTEFIEPNGDFNKPRLSFEETVAKIMADYDAAFALLPYIYSDKATDIPAKDAGYNVNAYLTVNGIKYDQRINGKIVRALQARLKLFAASKALLNSPASYKESATYATSVLAGYTMATDGVEFYNADNDNVNPEILWRQTVSSNYTQEQNNFPPSLNGNGNVNPTQNLVNAFYMSDGYPVGKSPTKIYNPQLPYANRDARLAKYIVFNGGTIGSTAINTTALDTKNGVNAVAEQSTRTGYYLKKLLRPDVIIPASGTPVAKNHFNVYIRYTELFLILAEAQNELGGPDYKEGASTLSAKDILRAIRKRAMTLTTDPYLDAVTSQTELRTLIQNERRLELCFEGFRFWDLRRWGLPLNETATGYYDKALGAGYQLIDVEQRTFTEEKYRYLPLPYNEIRKYSNLVQNAGW